MEGARLRLALALVFAVIGLALGAGCGGSEGSEGELSAEEAARSLSLEPARYMRRILATLKTAKTTEDCEEVAALNRRSPFKLLCTAATGLRPDTPTIHMNRVATYGPAAVIDYNARRGTDVASIILVRDRSGEWALDGMGLLSKESVGSSDDEQRQAAGEIVESYLAAVRDQDCDAFDKLAITAAAERRNVCRQDLRATQPLARFLEANPGAKSRYVGGNATYRFYSIDGVNPEPARYTIVAVKTPEGSLRPFVVLASQASPPPS